jgi:hypothetical protein
VSPPAPTPRPIPPGPISAPLPSVIDHSTQTGSTNHPLQPFNISRRPGEDQAEMLSRFLYVAGAALAASLVGSSDTAAAQWQDFNADFTDNPELDLSNAPEGSFEGFLRALRAGRTEFAHALRNESDTTHGEDSGSGFTYLLMYRFNLLSTTSLSATSTTTSEESDATTTTNESQSTTPNTSSSETTSSSADTPPEPRMIPFVIIGVQPAPPRDSGHASVPSFSEGVASLLANARNVPDRMVRSSTSGSGNQDSNGDDGLQSAASMPGAWQEPSTLNHVRRRASVDGSYRHASTNTNPLSTRDREANTRAWQMYIYGGAYPENHLIFTAPTLFTDVILFGFELIVDTKYRGHAYPRINSRGS